MMSSFSFSTLSLFTEPQIPLIRRRNLLCCLHKPRKPLRVSASLAQRNLELSWSVKEQKVNDDEEFNGWGVAVVECDGEQKQKTDGLRVIKLVVGGVAAAASLAVLVGAVAYFSLGKKGINYVFLNPLESVHGILGLTKPEADQSKVIDSGASIEDALVSGTCTDSKSNDIGKTVSSDRMEAGDKCRQFMIPIAADSMQQEALFVLKNLKIIEDDVEANKLCTRREYVRWLVRLNSLLERNPKHRIIPSIALAGSVVAAFDDVNARDPDFGAIQALAEAGIIPSRLSGKGGISDGFGGEGYIHFFPERLLSRQDLIDWKAQLEYEITPGIIEQISKTKLDYMDVKEIRSHASPELFMDILAGEKSIVRKVFGQSKRFQPNKPSTKAQVAVALASGRMTEAINNELSRLEAENRNRQAEMAEIRTVLLEKGDITRFWDEKLEEEKSRGHEVEDDYHSANRELERGKIDLERNFSEYLKEKAALDCQKQLLLSLREEVNEVSDRLAYERAEYESEHLSVGNTLVDIQNHLEGLLDKKSILEAEKEAIRILRTWIEDEARRNQARAKVLEEVGQRWKWDNQA